MGDHKTFRCKACTRGGVRFVGIASDGRPRFGCDACGDRFTAGLDGREYAVLVPKDPKEKVK